MLQARFANAGKECDDDDDGQAELLTEYLARSPESRCAVTQLRQVAEDAEAGLRRAVLETVADLVHVVSSCDGPTRLQARLQPIDWETAHVSTEMLYPQRSACKLRACTLSARGPLDDMVYDIVTFCFLVVAEDIEIEFSFTKILVGFEDGRTGHLDENA
jgi:hypothetical protein